MSGCLELEEVSSEYIEVEVDTSDILLLEPLLDHNYNARLQDEASKSNPERLIKLNMKRKLNKLPRMTKLSALYNCNLCGFMTMQRDCIVAHRETHQTKPLSRLVPCNKCKAKDSLEDCHRCPKCSYVAKKSSHLKLHMHIHSKGHPFKCRECNYAGKAVKDLVNHYRTAKNLYCHMCPYSNHWKVQFMEHLKMHAADSSLGPNKKVLDKVF